MAPDQIVDPRRVTPGNVFRSRLAYDTLRPTPEVVHAAKNGALPYALRPTPYALRSSPYSQTHKRPSMKSGNLRSM